MVEHYTQCLIATNQQAVYLQEQLKAVPPKTLILMDFQDDKALALSSFYKQILPAEAVCGRDFKNRAFFYPYNDLIRYVAICAAQYFLNTQEDCLLWINALPKISLPSLDTPSTWKTWYIPTEVEDCFEPVAYSFTSGEHTKQFLNWCKDRYDWLYNNGYSTISDREHTGAMGDEQAYTSVLAMEQAAGFGVSCFTAFLSSGEAFRAKEDGKVYSLFEDGTAVHPLLKAYFVRNYRLRLACERQPFAKRQLFTDKTVFTGEIQKKVPLTAMADCIWQQRPDLQGLYPAYKLEQRTEYMQWFVANAPKEYGLEEVYVLAVRQALQNKSDTSLKPRTGILQKVLHRDNMPEPVYEYPHGINYCAHIRGEYGIGEASRMMVYMVNEAEIPFTIVDFASERNYCYTNLSWEHKITNTFLYNTNIFHTNADGLQPFLDTVSPEILQGRYNIGHWAWEMPEFPVEWKPAFAPLQEVWTVSNFAAESIQAASPIPVRCMHHPVVLSEPLPQYTREYFDLPQDAFLFLSMYDVRSVVERKNPMGAINAFLASFSDDAACHLAVKVNAPSGWKPEGELSDLLAQHSNIHFISQNLTRDALNGLIANCDAFVSLHRSEGFGICPAEAMYYGKPTVLTNWSGNTDYMRPNACCPVEYTLIELERNYGPYQKGWHWAEPDIDSAVGYMKRLVTDGSYRQEIGQNGQRVIRTEFSAHACGERLKKRMVELGQL